MPATIGGTRVDIDKDNQWSIFGHKDLLAGRISEGYAQIGEMKEAP